MSIFFPVVNWEFKMSVGTVLWRVKKLFFSLSVWEVLTQAQPPWQFTAGVVDIPDYCPGPSRSPPGV